MPLHSGAGQRALGFLVAGATPRLKLDEPQISFLNLVAAQISQALMAADAYQQERVRAEALAKLDRAKTVFFSNISHEFRTPLTLLLGPLDEVLSRNESRLPEADRSLVVLAHRNGQRLLKLVNSLLEFSRLEAGHVTANRQSLDLARDTRELASHFRAACDKAGIFLDVTCEPETIPAFVDPDMWETIVLNLLSNAFKYTLRGGIMVGLRSDGESVALSVHDTGIGIARHELPRLFERFHRAEGTEGRSMEGTGIGLALVQELVTLQKGHVGAESVFGKGSTFTVTLPLGIGESVGETTPPSLKRAPNRAGAFGEEALRWIPERANVELAPSPANFPSHRAILPRILVADDNADMREYIGRLLGNSYDVRTAIDGAEALDMLKRGAPDLVLTDVMMPKMDGFELLRSIRSDPALANLPVIMLSARAGDTARIEGLTKGADDYLVKPFSAGDLLARIQRSLDVARRQSSPGHRERTA